MKSKTVAVIGAVCISMFSCGNPSQENTIAQTTSNSVERLKSSSNSLSNSNSNTIVMTDVEARDKSVGMSWDIVSQSTVMRNICRIDSLVLVGNKSIKPINLEALKDLSEITPETIDSFIEKNKISRQFDHGFDVYAKTKYIEVHDTIESTLRRIKKDSPKFDKLILLSQVGSTSNGSQSIVYFESYDSVGLIVRQFCLIKRGEGATAETRFIDAD
jgi:hypothetical protein